jgi:hypothetical protein
LLNMKNNDTPAEGQSQGGEVSGADDAGRGLRAARLVS